MVLGAIEFGGLLLALLERGEVRAVVGFVAVVMGVGRLDISGRGTPLRECFGGHRGPWVRQCEDGGVLLRQAPIEPG